MRRRLAVLAFAAAGLALASCDLLSEAKSHTLMISELVATPDESLGTLDIPGGVAASVLLVTIDPTNPQSASAQPIPSAEVTLEFLGNSIALASADGGAYYADSHSTPALTYVVGATYRFQAVVNGATYAQYVQAPEREYIKEFHTGLTPYSPSTFGIDAGGLLGAFDAGGLLLADGGLPPLPDGGSYEIPTLPLTDGGSFTLADLDLADGGLPGFVAVSPGMNLALTRSNAVNGTPAIAATVVLPLGTNFVPQKPSFTSPDTSVIGVLSLVFSPQAYQTSTITIPGPTAWPSCPPSDFILAVTGLKAGTNENSNLFTASTSFAGSADAAPAHCIE